MTELNEGDWKVVEERLKDMPKTLNLGILGKSLNKEELLKEVQERTEIGKAYAEMQLGFIRWLAKQSKLT